MVPNLTIFFLILTFSGLCLTQVRGRSLSKQQQSPISIEENGQIYDCVDFYEQPAFKNALLRNFSSKARSKLVPNEGTKAKEFGLKNGGCSYGTVPILRMPQNFYHISQSDPALGFCSATVFTVQNGRKFLGANGALSLHRPKTFKAGQWSLARVSVSNGPEFIQAGWMVYPDLFKDNEPHLVIRFKGKQGGECINMQCPGFVQRSPDIPLGRPATKFGEFGGLQYFWNITIEKHIDDGNWWLDMFGGGKKYSVGYFPSDLFNGLANFATEASWGGEVNSVDNDLPIPEMGNGYLADLSDGTSKVAYVQHITVIDESYNSVNPDNTKKYWPCEASYSVKDFGYRDEYWGHTLLYGGPANNFN